MDEGLFLKLKGFIHSSYRSLFTSVVEPPAPGLYHFSHQSKSESSRLHLRFDTGGDALLLVNANRVVHLNPTAAFMAYLVLMKVSEGQAIHSLRQAYNVAAQQAQNDFSIVSNQIQELIRPDGACPLHDLDLEVSAPFSSIPSAPYRMDLALTYRCNNDCPHCYNARSRNHPELYTQDWIRIIDQLWEIGIPHIVFTGGEPTLRDDLPELIAHAQKNGQITGINTNGRRLSDKHYVDTLIQAGLDHVQITLESHLPDIHDVMVNSRGAWKQTLRGLNNVLQTRLFVMTNTTLLEDNSPYLSETLEFLGNTGVPTVGLNALIYSGRGLSVGKGLAEDALYDLLEIAKQKTHAFGQRLIWYTPTQYCQFDPMRLDLGVKGCTAALYNMCVESNGDVLPCQSYYRSLGNILRDDWSSIWNHDLCKDLRERRYVQTKCQGCALLTECGGGCPLSYPTG